MSGLGIPSCGLINEILWGSNHCKDSSMLSSVLKLSLAASVYYIWEERNSRIFQQVRHDFMYVQRLIVEAVKAQMSSWRHMRMTTKNLALMLDWGLSASVLCDI